MMDNQNYFRGPYPNLNPSPTSSRQGYNTVSGGMQSRMQRQQLEVNPMYHDDQFNSYGNSVRNARMQSPQGYVDNVHPGFMMSNNQAWAQNVHSSGANTINGAMTEAPRGRSAHRPALPADWMGESRQASHNYSSQFQMPGHLGAPMNLMNGNATLSTDRLPFQRDNQSNRQQTPKTLAPDLIPTAIVIKNIPFNVRKEHLAQVMQDLNLPTPYAFNYHFDNGIFRGLAFANFQNPDDTYQVIEALNGIDVHGRKLRVEYKKMLPEAERERIEREKREKRGQLEEQHQPIKGQQQMMHLAPAHATNQPSPSRDGAFRDLDMNDEDTMRFYTELLLFKSDQSREIVIFPPTMGSAQRRIVHTLAHHMGLSHSSVGEGGQRQLHVVKPHVDVSAATSNPINMTASHQSQSRGLNRAATIDFAETRSVGGLGTYGHTLSSRASRPTLEVQESGPVDMANLRGVKSFADLRDPRSTPSPAPSMSGFGLNGGHNSSAAMYSEYTSAGSYQPPSSISPTTPGGSQDPSMLIAGLNGMNLGGPEPTGYPQASLRAPGAIGSQRPGPNGINARQQPERQPINPGQSQAEFGNWRTGRPNGHSQRDSDSSDNGVRGLSGSRFN